MAFEEGLNKLLNFENKYSMYSAGRNGESYCGISRKYFPRWSGWPIIDGFHNKDDIIHEDLAEAVSDFYYIYFWMKIGCQYIDDSFISGMIFNMSVYMGKKQTVKKVQRVLQVKPDGLIGPETTAPLNAMEPQLFIYHFILELVEFYAQLSPHNSGERGLNRALSFYYQYERQL